MIRGILLFIIIGILACGQHTQSVSKDSYAAFVSGIYEGRLVTHSIDSVSYRIRIDAISDSSIRISPEANTGNASFIARVSGPSNTVLRIYYSDEQIGTIIGGVLKYKRSLGADYHEYFSGTRQEK